MKDEGKDYSFVVGEKKSFRFNAGGYDVKTKLPKYTIDISAPEHVKNYIVMKQSIMGTPGNHLFVWDIKNDSNYPIFIIAKRDGELIDIYGEKIERKNDV